MKHSKFRKSLSVLMAAVLSVQMFLPAAAHAPEEAPRQTAGSVQTLAEPVAGEDRQFDDRDPMLKFSEEWSTWNENGHINGTITYTNKVDATLDVTFRGTGVVLYAQKTYNSGMMEISVDGGAPTKVDFYTSADKGLCQQVVYKAEGLDPNKKHTLHAVLLKERNPDAGSCQVAIDAVTVLGYDERPVIPVLPGETVIFESAFDKGEMGEWGHEAATTLELVEDAELGKQVLKITPSKHNEFIDLLSAGKIQNGRLTFKFKSEQPLGQKPFARHQTGENGTFAGCWTNGWYLGDDTKYIWENISQAPVLEGEKWRDITLIFNGDHYVFQCEDVEWEGDKTGLNTAPGYCGIMSNDGENKHPLLISDVVVTTTDPRPQFELSGSSMTLGSALRMEFYVKNSDLPEDTSGVYAVVNKHFADGSTVEKKVPFDQWLTRGDMRYIPFDGVAAKEMMDPFTVQVFDKDGNALSKVRRDSIHDYTHRILDDPKQSTELKTLLVDMLNYGAEAQKQFGYDVEQLANADLTADEQKLATQTVEMEDTLVAGENYAGTAPSLNSNIRLTMYFRGTAEGMNAVASYTDHYGRSKTVEVKKFDTSWDGHYGVHVDTLAVADARQPVKVEVKDAQGKVVASATDSIESYAARMSQKNDIYEAMMKFGTSSFAYFKNQK